MLDRTANSRGNAMPVRVSSRKTAIATVGTQTANRLVRWENLTDLSCREWRKLQTLGYPEGSEATLCGAVWENTPLPCVLGFPVSSREIGGK